MLQFLANKALGKVRRSEVGRRSDIPLLSGTNIAGALCMSVPTRKTCKADPHRNCPTMSLLLPALSEKGRYGSGSADAGRGRGL